MRNFRAVAASLTVLIGAVGALQAQNTTYWEGELTLRGARLPVRLAIQGQPGHRGVRLDLPTMLMAWEPLGTTDTLGRLRVEFPFGLGALDVTPAGRLIASSAPFGADGRDTLRLRVARAPAPPYTLEEVRFRSGDVTLAGTLVLPSSGGPHPAMVLVHGSGNVDRRQWEYRSQADFLARQGFAAFIYDKRGVGESGGAWWEADEGFADLAADVLAAVSFVRARPDIRANRIGLLGGSQAGWVMVRAASTSRDVAFLVLESAPAISPAEQEI